MMPFLVLLPTLLGMAAPRPDSDLERMGTHIFLELYDAPFAYLNSSSTVLSALRNAVSTGGLTVVGELLHEFPIMGISAVLLISESHLSIHTWPERGYAAVDLFTCGHYRTSLPCTPHEPIRVSQGQVAWRCADGTDVAQSPHPMWHAVQALRDGLQAGGAKLMWLERGLPPEASAYNRALAKQQHAAAATPLSSGAFGWLSGLEGEHQQRPEL